MIGSEWVNIKVGTEKIEEFYKKLENIEFSNWTREALKSSGFLLGLYEKEKVIRLRTAEIREIIDGEDEAGLPEIISGIQKIGGILLLPEAAPRILLQHGKDINDQIIFFAMKPIFVPPVDVIFFASFCEEVWRLGVTHARMKWPPDAKWVFSE